MAMIYLYDSHTTDFTYNGQPLPKSYDVVVRRFINGEYFVTWKHSIDKEKVYKAIQKDKIITAHTPDGMQPFRIMEPVKTMDYVEFEAWPLLYADMRNKLVRPISLRNATGQQAISAFLNNLLLDTPFVFTTNITTRHDYHTQSEEERENNPNQLYDALEVFKDIVSRWNGELIINGYDIRIVNRIGVDKQALLYEKKNINNYLDRESISGIVTRLYGKSEWVEYLEGGESINHSINISVDSPLIDSYNGIIFEKQYTNNDIRSEQEMRNWLNLKFTSKNIDKPNRSIELDTNIVDDEEIHLGDGLVLKYLKHDVDMQIRMIGYDFDGYANRYLRAYLGDAKASFVGSISNTVSNVQNDLRQETDHKTHVILNRQGVKVIYSPTEPTGNFRTDDIWFDNDGGMYKYDSERSDWIPHPYNRRSDIVKQMVEDQQKDIQSAQSSADTANQQINDAINAAGFSTLADLTADIQSISNRADANALAARDSALSATTTAESAMTLATDLSGQVSDFELTVNGFNQTVNNYEDQVAQFTSDVNGLNSTVASYETQVDEFGNTVSTYATQVSQFENTVNGLNSTVSNYQSDVQGYQAQVSTLTNTIDGFNATVQRVEADYSGLSGTVQSLGASIGVVEGQITNKVWQTDIQSAVQDIEVGGRNLLLNSEYLTTEGSNASGISRRINDEGYLEVTASPGNNNYASNFGINNSEVISENLNPGDTFTFSIEMKSEDSTDIPLVYFRGEMGYYQLQGTMSPEFSKMTYTGVWTQSTVLLNFHMGFKGRSGTFVMRKAKLEKGNKATDWTPAPEDTVQLISNVESEWRQTAQGFEQDITRVETGLDGKASLTAFNTLSSTVDGTVTRVGDAEGRLTTVETNVSGLQTTVANKADKSQITQLSNAIDLKVGTSEVETLIRLDKRILDTRNDNESPEWYQANYNRETVREFKFASTVGITSGETYGVLETIVPWSNSSGGNIKQTFFQNNRTYIRSGVSAWSAWEEIPHKSYVNSQVTVLQNAINLRVKEGEVMSQINIEAGRTLIQSNRLYLDSSSVVFSGSAFIPNAAIESLSATKITTGTLNAANVNLINLNASSITTGTLSGANMFLNLNTGVFTTTSQVNNQLAGSMSINYGRLESVSNIGTGRFVTLSGDQLHFGDTNGYIELTPRYIDFNANNRTARMRFNGTNIVFDNGSLGMNRNHINSVDWIRIIGQEGDTMDTAIFNSPNHPGSIISDSRQITIGLGTREAVSRIASFSGNIQFMRNLFMNSNTISGAHAITFNDSTTMLASSIGPLGGGALIDGSAITIGLRTSPDGRGHDRVAEFYGQIHFYRNLYMNGRNVVDTSDERKKHGIVDAEQDSLQMIRDLTYRNFYWNDSEISPDEQFGLIAQEADPSLTLYNEDKDEYGINQNRLTHTIGHAVQQLSEEHDNTLLVASHAYLLAEQHEDELECLKKEVKELKEEIEELRGMGA